MSTVTIGSVQVDLPADQVYLYQESVDGSTVYKYKYTGVSSDITGEIQLHVLTRLNVDVTNLPCLVYKQDFLRALSTAPLDNMVLTIAADNKPYVKYIESSEANKADKYDLLTRYIRVPSMTQFNTVSSAVDAMRPIVDAIPTSGTGSLIRVYNGDYTFVQSAIRWRNVKNVQYGTSEYPGIIALATDQTPCASDDNGRATTPAYVAKAIDDAIPKRQVLYPSPATGYVVSVEYDENGYSHMFEDPAPIVGIDRLAPNTDYIYKNSVAGITISEITSSSKESTIQFSIDTGAGESDPNIVLPDNIKLDDSINKITGKQGARYLIRIQHGHLYVDTDEFNVAPDRNSKGILNVSGTYSNPLGWYANSVNVRSGYSCVVYSGATATDFNVPVMGRLVASNGGKLINPTVAGQGTTSETQAYCDLFSGGICSGGSMHYAQFVVRNGATVIDATIEAPGWTTFHSGSIASRCLITQSEGTGGSRRISKGSMYDCTLGGKVQLIAQGGAVLSGLCFTESATVKYTNVSVLHAPIASNCAANYGIILSSGMTAFDPVVRTGGVMYTYADTLTSNMLVSGGFQDKAVASARPRGGVISGLSTVGYAEVIATSTSMADVDIGVSGYFTTRSGAVVTNLNGHGSGLIRVSNGSIVSNCTILSGMTMYTGASSYVENVRVGNNGWYVAYMSCNCNGLVIEEGGSVWISGGGYCSNVTVMAGGTLTLDSTAIMAYSGNENEIPHSQVATALNITSQPGAVINVISGIYGAGHVEYAAN